MTYWNQWCPKCTSNETMQNCEGCRRGVSKPTEWVEIEQIEDKDIQDEIHRNDT